MKVKKVIDRWFPNYTCQACGTEINLSDNPYLCARCLADLPLLLSTGTHLAPFAYAEPVRTMILKLKYTQNGLIAAALAPYLAAVYLQNAPRDFDPVLVPVPLYRKRQRQRGYNQSFVLAEALADYLHCPIVAHALIRVKPTVPQKHMDAATRAANVKDAFAVVDDTLLRNRDVILLDDVYTTGATAQACVTTLRAHGVKRVLVLTIATAGL